MQTSIIEDWVEDHDNDKIKNAKAHLAIGHLLRDEIQLTTMKRKYFNRLIVDRLIQLGQDEDGKDEKSWPSM